MKFLGNPSFASTITNLESFLFRPLFLTLYYGALVLGVLKGLQLQLKAKGCM
jgi:hypothetical protein